MIPVRLFLSALHHLCHKAAMVAAASVLESRLNWAEPP